MNENPAVETDAAFPEETGKAGDFRSIGVARLWFLASAFTLLCAGFFPVVGEWLALALAEDLHSHVILIPVKFPAIFW